MRFFPAFLVVVAVAAFTMHARAATVVPVDEDVMTSSFFIGADLVRGYPGDARPVFRVSTHQPFGLLAAETVYLTFDLDFTSLSGPLPKAILTVQSIPGGFSADASAGNPFPMSAHGVTADPLSSITDDTNPSGPISWSDFYANNILPAPAEAHTSVDGFGTLEFDVTALVNSWIDGTNSVFAIALTGKNDTSGNDFLHGIANNSESVGASYLTLVPEPSTWLLLAMGLAAIAAKKLSSR